MASAPRLCLQREYLIDVYTPEGRNYQSIVSRLTREALKQHKTVFLNPWQDAHSLIVDS